VSGGNVDDRARERGLDPGLASLAGEASEQGVPSDPGGSEGAPPFGEWGRRPAGSFAPDSPTYYERSVVKEPTWIWTVPAYFFVGGAAGAAAVLAGVARAVDADGHRALVRNGRRLAAAGTALGSVLLIVDLGRPERFLNMLRVFRASSPMSVGSWLLAGCGTASGIAAALEPFDGGLAAVGDVAGLASAVTGPPLAVYTAVLVSNTAVPLWRAVRRSLPALFGASACSSAASILQLLVTSDRDRRVLRAFAATGLAAEIGAAAWLDREASAIERVGAPLREGSSGALWRASKGAAVLGLVATLIGDRSTSSRWVGAILAIGSSLAMRVAIWRGGRASARDPRATFDQSRASSS
jgi:formate-dependent nitrite reductase membrane component NrfD